MPADVARADAESLLAACQALSGLYAVDDWWPARSRFEVMVGAVLVQNTRWTNVRRAIGALRTKGWLNPGALSAARPGALSQAIRPAGCQSVKANRLRHLARGVKAGGGISRLAGRPTPALRQQLLEWHGIGEETADAILLYAFDRPVFIADAYARRWLRRMGLFDSGCGAGAYGRCRQFVGERLGPGRLDHQALHAAIVMHGQVRCGRLPRCETCPLLAKCEYIKQQDKVII